MFGVLRELTGSEVEPPDGGAPQLSFALAGKVELPADDKLVLLRELSERRRVELVQELLEVRGPDGSARAAGRRARVDERQGRPRVGSRERARAGAESAWGPAVRWPRGRDDGSEARRAPPSGGLRGVRRAREREAGRVPRFGRVDAEAAAGARHDARVLRALVRQRPPRRLPARRARDDRLRDGARQGRGLRERAVRARGDLHAQRDRGAQPRGVCLGPRQPRPRRRGRRHRSRAPLELRPVAVRRGPHGGVVQGDPDRRVRRAATRRARRDRARGDA